MFPISFSLPKKSAQASANLAPLIYQDNPPSKQSAPKKKLRSLSINSVPALSNDESNLPPAHSRRKSCSYKIPEVICIQPSPTYKHAPSLAATGAPDVVSIQPESSQNRSQATQRETRYRRIRYTQPKELEHMTTSPPRGRSRPRSEQFISTRSPSSTSRTGRVQRERRIDYIHIVDPPSPPMRQLRYHDPVVYDPLVHSEEDFYNLALQPYQKMVINQSKHARSPSITPSESASTISSREDDVRSGLSSLSSRSASNTGGRARPLSYSPHGGRLAIGARTESILSTRSSKGFSNGFSTQGSSSARLGEVQLETPPSTPPLSWSSTFDSPQTPQSRHSTYLSPTYSPTRPQSCSRRFSHGSEASTSKSNSQLAALSPPRSNIRSCSRSSLESANHSSVHFSSPVSVCSSKALPSSIDDSSSSSQSNVEAKPKTTTTVYHYTPAPISEAKASANAYKYLRAVTDDRGLSSIRSKSRDTSRGRSVSSRATDDSNIKATERDRILRRVLQYTAGRSRSVSIGVGGTRTKKDRK
jgi:hypothetical protein